MYFKTALPLAVDVVVYMRGAEKPHPRDIPAGRACVVAVQYRLCGKFLMSISEEQVGPVLDRGDWRRDRRVFHFRGLVNGAGDPLWWRGAAPRARAREAIQEWVCWAGWSVIALLLQVGKRSPGCLYS